MWVRLSVFMLVALISAAAAGAWFGQRLVEDAPFGAGASGTPGATELNRIADGSGQALVPEPPQPRMDGTLGVPVRPAGTAVQAPLVSLFEQESRGIAISTTAPTASDLDSFIANLESGQSTQQGHSFAIAPAQSSLAPATSAFVPVPPPPPARTARPDLPPDLAFAVAQPAEQARPAWQQALASSLGRCNTQRFFTPAECEQRLRLQYCEPNGAWGRVPECPMQLRGAGLR